MLHTFESNFRHMQLKHQHSLSSSSNNNNNKNNVYVDENIGIIIDIITIIMLIIIIIIIIRFYQNVYKFLVVLFTERVITSECVPVRVWGSFLDWYRRTQYQYTIDGALQ